MELLIAEVSMFCIFLSLVLVTRYIITDTVGSFSNLVPLHVYRIHPNNTPKPIMDLLKNINQGIDYQKINGEQNI